MTDSSTPIPHRNEHSMSVGRAAAFSDGVFAIAMTLLVLSLAIPASQSKSAAELERALRDQTPGLISYALSFAVLGRYWMAHHQFMRSVARVTDGFLTCTLLFLGVVVLVSFPTDVLGNASGSAVTVAAIFYALVIGSVGATFALLEYYAYRKALLFDERAARLRWSIAKVLVAPTVFFVSILIAVFAGGRAAMWTWVAIIPAGIVVERLSRARMPDAS